MAGFTGKFDSIRQDWPTPTEVFDPINAEFHFTLDAAASPENAKCRRYFTSSDDGFKRDWTGETVWLNPPYGDKGYSLAQWVRKSHAESMKGATIVLLIPARTNTSWFHDVCLKFAEVRFVRGRPKFGGATHGLPQPLCFVIFRGDISRRFSVLLRRYRRQLAFAAKWQNA